MGLEEEVKVSWLVAGSLGPSGVLAPDFRAAGRTEEMTVSAVGAGAVSGAESVASRASSVQV